MANATDTDTATTCRYPITWHAGMPEERHYMRTASAHVFEYYYTRGTDSAESFDIYRCANCGREEIA